MKGLVETLTNSQLNAFQTIKAEKFILNTQDIDHELISIAIRYDRLTLSCEVKFAFQNGQKDYPNYFAAGMTRFSNG